MSIKIGIVDDHYLFLEGIQSILDTIDNFEVVLAVTSGPSLFNQLEKKQVDILLLDLEMEPSNGIDIFHQLHEDHPGIKVIILTMHSEPELISHLMKAGVNGYLLKDTNKAEFEMAINTVYLKGHYFNENVSKAMLEALQTRSMAKKPQLGNHLYLTSREMEVLELIAKEYTTQEIAQKLFLSPKTIEGHRKSLLSKFNVKNTAGLIIKAIEKKIISVKGGL